MLVWPSKGPTEVLDYDLLWAGRLSGDTIVASTWAITAGDGALIIASSSYTANITKVFLAGGTVGQLYQLTNTIVTAGGDVEVASVQFLVKAK